MPKIQVDDKLIWYSVHGEGQQPVLVLPGAIGTIKSDFYVQLDPSSEHCFDFKRFKWISVELHGWGCLNQERQYDINMLEVDANYCHQIMRLLGFDRYSIYAWSEGGKVALTLAHWLGPKVILSVIIQAVLMYQSPISTKHLMWSRNVENWDAAALKKYTQAYGGDVQLVSRLWNRHMDYIETFKSKFPHGVLGPPEKGLQNILCPTLVLHGDKDFFVELEQAKYVVDNIPGAKLTVFPGGLHNLHQIDSKKFKKIVEDFFSTH